MKFVNEANDELYKKVTQTNIIKGNFDSLYLEDEDQVLTIELEITDIIKANLLVNMLKYDHDGNISKALGVKMKQYKVTGIKN